MNLFHKIILCSLALTGALGINAMEAHAKPLVRLIPAAKAPAAYTDKVDALAYIAAELRVTDPGCQAYESLLRYEREIRSGKAEPSAVRELANLYRAGRHAPKGDPIGDIIGKKMGWDVPTSKPATKPSSQPISQPTAASEEAGKDATEAQRVANAFNFKLAFGG